MMPNYTTPYCDLTWAEQYFAERSNSDNWNEATEAEKSAALATATRDIYHYATFFESLPDDARTGEEKQPFKYAYDGSETRTIPDLLKEATCEQAIYKITVNRLDAIDATRSGIASAKGVTFDRDAVPDQLCAECIDILDEMGAEVAPSAGSSGWKWTRQERLER